MNENTPHDQVVRGIFMIWHMFYFCHLSKGLFLFVLFLILIIFVGLSSAEHEQAQQQ